MNINIKNIVVCVISLIALTLTAITLTHTSSQVFSMEKKIILLDPGHGGFDPGKVVPQGNAEKDINLKIACYLLSYLEQNGATVYMTRIDDAALSETKRDDLKARRKLSDSDKVDAMVSIHQNYYPSANVHGAQVFYPSSSEEAKLLADSIQKRISQLADTSNKRVIKENASYYLLKNTKKPSVIVECGFLSNPKENALLNSEEYQKKIAWAIFLGITDYFSFQNKL